MDAARFRPAIFFSIVVVGRCNLMHARSPARLVFGLSGTMFSQEIARTNALFGEVFKFYSAYEHSFKGEQLFQTGGVSQVLRSGKS